MERMAASELAPYLARDETLLWSGRPDPLLYALSNIGAATIAAIVFLAALAIFGGAVVAGLFRPELSGGSAFAAAFFTVPLVMVSGTTVAAPMRRYREAKRLAYGLTDRRAIILRGGERSRIVEMPAASLSRFRKIDHGRDKATIVFTRPDAHVDESREQALPRRQSFIGIANAQRLAMQLEEMGIRNGKT
jgi:hypothetical protein